jgi:AmmeMemoRadiSam system protein A
MRERLERGSVPRFTDSDPALLAPSGAFVTLLLDGDVRGCVGTVDAHRPLLETVVDVAVQAAVSDPAFPPLSLRELSRTDIELSVLTPFRPIAAAEVVPGRHGLYLVRGPRRSVLLPQVARQFRWSRAELLQQLSRRAGLEEDAWERPDVRLFAFEAEVFSNLGMLED